MHRREREIRRMVADLGMEITSFRTDGGSHWRVDVRTPNGRQRPFTFPTRDSHFRSAKNEEAMLRRWRREVMPELDAAEEAGTLQPPPPMRSQLAQKLAVVGIPLKVEPEPKPGKLALPHDLPPSHVSDVVLAASAVGDKKWENRVANIPPRNVRETMAPPFEPGTPEAALASSLGAAPAPAPAPTPAPTSAPAPKEPTMSAAPDHFAKQHPTTPGAKYAKNTLTQPQFYQLCKWVETPNILEGCWSYKDAAKKATGLLGFMVSDSSLERALKVTGVKMPEDSRSRNVKARDRLTIVAEAVVALYEKFGESVPHELLVAAKMAQPTSDSQH